MAFPSVTNTFANSTTADATQVNQNFTDIINGLSDTTKDISVNGLTVAGTATLNGNVVLGSSSSKTIMFTGSLSSSVSIGTNALYDIGSSVLGLASIYLGSAASHTTRLVGGATTTWTMTLPVTAGSADQILKTDGAGVTSWTNQPREVDNRSNYSFTTSVNSNAMTVTMNYLDGTALSVSQPANIYFRSSTAATGTNTLRTITSALTMVISSGATLGIGNAVNDFIYIYALDNAGTVELAVSASPMWDEGSLQTTTGISSSSTSRVILYSTTSRANVAIRLLGRITSNQTTSGTYTATAVESTTTNTNATRPRSSIFLQGGNGYGSTNTAIRRFTNIIYNNGVPDMTLTQSAANGDSVLIVTEGVYAISHAESTSAQASIGITLNGTSLSQIPQNLTQSELIAFSVAPANFFASCTATVALKAGDIIRAQNDNACNGTVTPVNFIITKVS